MPQREAPASPGIFDNKPRENMIPTHSTENQIPTHSTDEKSDSSVAVAPKEDFLNPFAESKKQISNREQSQRKPVADILAGEGAAEATAAAVNNQGNVQSDLDELDKIDPKDLELAEQMIFNDYADFDVKMPNLPNIKFTICSTNAEEMSIIDELIFDMVKKFEDDKGVVELPQNHVQSMRNAIFVALSYRGKNKEELMSSIGTHLNTIKKGIVRATDLFNAGEVEQAEKLKVSLKKAIMDRAIKVKRLPTPIIDFLSSEKYEFDAKMNRIMSSKKMLPKS